MGAKRVKAPDTLSSLTLEIQKRKKLLEERITRAAQHAGRSREDIVVVAVSKRQPLNHVAAGILAGICDLGENYVQEAQHKKTEITEAVGAPALDGVTWHMIGHLQQNKAAAACLHFDMIHSVDRPKLARALDRHAAAAERRLDILLQVNLTGETQKSGISEADLLELAKECASLPHLRLAGLMTVPAASPDPETSRPVFRRLREIRGQLCTQTDLKTVQHLSMGMSADFEVAIEEGATLIRVGTALFGPRKEFA
jgi:pyridoxal phosphate enzyme (YggS family)